jgi:mannose-6-phosphate isomerase-like protein (cupin superfamily)
MRNRLVIGIAVLLGLLAWQLGWTPTATSAKDSHSNAAAATDVTNAEVQAALQKIPTAAVSDQALRVVSVNGEYNVAVGVVRRARTTGPASGGAIEHSEITEVYCVTAGTGTLVTGGMLEGAKPIDPESEIVKVLVGPGRLGDKIQGGVSRVVGPGDVIVIPPNTPHWFSEVTSDRITYLVVRVDPKKVLPAGFKPK